MGLGGTALAVTNFVGSNGEIHGCVGTGGRLSVAKPGASCGKGKHQLVWNQRGPKGERGPKGSAGPGAIKIDFGPRGATPRMNVATLGPWTVALSCDVANPTNDARPQVKLWVKGPGTADYSTVGNVDDSAPQPTIATASVSLSSSAFTSVVTTAIPESPHTHRVVG